MPPGKLGDPCDGKRRETFNARAARIGSHKCSLANWSAANTRRAVCIASGVIRGRCKRSTKWRLTMRLQIRAIICLVHIYRFDILGAVNAYRQWGEGVGYLFDLDGQIPSPSA